MFFKVLSLLGAAMLCSSCATVVRGVNDKLRVLSDPPGANVNLSSGETGVTPTNFVKRRRDAFQVTVSKQGFVPQTVNVVSRASGAGAAATAGNIALGGPVGVAVDAGTGAWFSLYPNPVMVRLAPLPSGRRPSASELRRQNLPVATLSGQPGMVRSPYTQRLYNVQAVPHGARVHDVDVDKFFVNP